MKNTLLLLLALLGLTGRPAAGQPIKFMPGGRVLSISDIHFGVSAAAQGVLPPSVAQWADTLKKYDNQPLAPNTWQDSNYWLLVSSLAEMQARCPHPDFIVISGDLAAHSVGDYAFDSTSAQFALARGIYEFLRLQLASRFPQAVILPGLGNNDTDQGDDNPPSPAFLRMFARAWSPALYAGKAEQEAFVRAFAHRGYYSYALPGAPHRRLLMLNSVLFMGSKSACDLRPAAKVELDWLRDQLEAAEKANDQLWLTMHVPHGIDVFQTVSPYTTGLGCQDTLVNKGQPDALRVHSMWNAAAQTGYRTLVARHDARIRACLAGHTHMAEFRLLNDAANQPTAFLHLTPSISPYFGNNPGFQVLDYDPASLALLDVHTHYLNLSAPPAGLAVLPAGRQWQPTWQPEYSFNAAYQVSGVSLTTLAAVRAKIRQFGTGDQLKYALYYAGLALPTGTSPTPLSVGNWPYYYCATGATTPQEFCDCLKPWRGAAPPAATPPPAATSRR